jgi:hypothetical protein
MLSGCDLVNAACAVCLSRKRCSTIADMAQRCHTYLRGFVS